MLNILKYFFYILIFIILLYFNIAKPWKSNTQDNSSIMSTQKDKSTTNDIVAGGLTKTQWQARCTAYSNAKRECAVAANVNQCVEIKIGVSESTMSQIYCDGSTPNFSLMGVK
jgi:hypothetical protein